MPRVLWLLPLLFLLTHAAATAGVSSFSKNISVAGTTHKVTGVIVDLRDPGIGITIGLAQGRLGRTEALHGIATRHQAIAAINGSFFAAYSPDVIKNPDMSLISNGQLLFKSNLGAMLGFEEDNTPHLGVVRYRVGGSVGPEANRLQSWYAYWVNRKPTAAAAATLFTRHWGPAVTGLGGTSVVVDEGIVTAIVPGNAPIPERGFVLNLRGEASLLDRFRVGHAVSLQHRVSVTGTTEEAWSRVREAVGAGPRVLCRGVPIFNPSAEGFSDARILSASGMRSAAGFTEDGKLYLITCPSIRVRDLGYLLKALGCIEGMNLDGGASSGLWYRGRYLTRPGRQISNALLIVER